MKAYAQNVQQREMNCGIWYLKALKKWSGVEYVDSILKLAQGGVSTTVAMGRGRCHWGTI